MIHNTALRILLLVLLWLGVPSPQVIAEERPNIVVILADDLGWRDVGYHGSEIKTPTLDKMAAEGAVFDRFYVHSVCSPTRASLLTGRSPSRFGIYAVLGDTGGPPPGTATIASLLKQQGYETAMAGKWHLGAVPEARPLKFGFDSSYGYLRGQIDPYTHLYKDGQRSWHRNDQPADEAGHATDLITREAIRVIDGHKQKPLFLYVAYSVPHYPLDEPEQWVKPFRDSIQNESRRLYAAAVAHMDYSIGRILTALRQNKMQENTVVLFLSDNGGQQKWGSPASEYHGKFKANDVLGNNLPLRDWKTKPYDGALRVPAVLYWPGRVVHRTIQETINVADVLPTLVHLGGAKTSNDLKLDGIDFWPAIQGNKLPMDRLMYWRSPLYIVLKKGDWKLIHFGKVVPKADLQRGGKELYNLSLDPYEEKNVAREHPGKVDELKMEMERQMSGDP